MPGSPSVPEQTQNVEPAPALSARVRRTPFYLKSQNAWLFAWLHQSAVAGQCQRGVIICAPLGYEQIHAHRSVRHLADALAEAGFPVVRVDYHGTGDSAGVDEDADRHATWLANLGAARRWLLDEMGCVEISFVGLRLGAALAAQVAALEAVHDLVLWAPVIKGRTYVREMKAISMTAGAPAISSNDIEAAGFVMTEQTAHDLGGVDLLQTRPMCRRALIVSRDDLPAQGDSKLLDHLGSLGIEARQTAQPGYAEMMAEPHFTKVPHQAIAEITAWMRNGLAGDMRAEMQPERVWPTEALLPCEPSGPLRERAVRICQEPDLFGILCEPAASVTSKADAPAVLLLNAGSAYHAGPNRLHVLLARNLAANGFSCLRMDLCGLGDSVTPDLARENDTYPATAFRDIDLALRFLQQECGAKRVVLMGLCSGAYAAFQSAAQFQSPALVASFIVNPLTFYWKEGMALESAESLKFQAFHYSMEAARQPGKWLKLLTGRSKLGIGGAFRQLIERWKLRRQLRRQAQRVGNEDGPAAVPSHPENNDLPGDLARIVKRRRPVTFFFARSDPGYDILTFQAKRQVGEMCRTGQMRIIFIEDADHTFSRRVAREAFFKTVVAELSGFLANASG